MKLFSCKQLREIDQYTIKHEPISSINLMERAAQKCTDWILANYINKTFHIYAGPGNNGGDGLAIARQLIEAGKKVTVFMPPISTKLSPDCHINIERFKAVALKGQLSYKPSQKIEHDVICIDAIFGSGLSRTATGTAQSTIEHINKYNIVIAIDIPSGLFGENNPEHNKTIVKASHTLTFDSPKLSFLSPQWGRHCGILHILNINLHPKAKSKAPTPYFFTTKKDINKELKNRDTFSHKGTFGHSLLIAGEKGKSGAAILAALSCLRSGTGLLTALSTDDCYLPLQTSTPEAMVITDTDHLPSKVNAIGIGPGLGTSSVAKGRLEYVLKNHNTKPIILDADALNIISKDKTLLKKLPENTILTPHPKEYERLFGVFTSKHEDFSELQQLCKSLQIIIVLKGRYTCVGLPNGELHFNSSGNEGMATAGSGDCLTGIILSLLAQGYLPDIAAKLGVFIHGLAGDYAKEEIGSDSLIASDIIKSLPKAFKTLRNIE